MVTPTVITSNGSVNGALFNSGAADTTHTTPGIIAAGQMVMVFVAGNNLGSTDTISAISDSAGNNYVVTAVAANTAGSFVGAVAVGTFVLGSQLSAGATFKATTSSGGQWFLAGIYSVGSISSATPDASGSHTVTSNANTSDTCSTGSLTGTTDFVAGFAYASSSHFSTGTGWTPPGSFTNADKGNYGATNTAFAFDYLNPSGTGSVTYNPSWSVGTTDAVMVLAFKTGAAASTPVLATPRRIFLRR